MSIENLKTVGTFALPFFCPAPALRSLEVAHCTPSGETCLATSAGDTVLLMLLSCLDALVCLITCLLIY